MAVQISGNDITVPRDGTFSRNVSIAGTLTYEDVTNIDSIGLVTARNGIEVGASPGVAASVSVDGNAIFSGITTIGGNVKVGTGVTLSPDGNAFFTGVITATTFSGVDTDKISEGNTEAEVVDTNSDGHFKVTTEGTERVRIGPAGQLGIAGANYGSTGQVLTSQGSGSVIQWATPALLQIKYEGNNTTISRNASGMADIGFGSVQITPKLSSSIMIVSFTGRGYANGSNQSYFSFFFSEDGGSYSQVPGLDSNGMSRIINGDDFTLSMRYAHDHNTTSVLEYKIYASVGGGTTYLNWDSTYGLLTVEEIAS